VPGKGDLLNLDKDRLRTYREKTFRLQPGSQLRSVEEALAFVEERGFILFWPIKGVDLPSLWTAVAGDRPVPDDHDDPAHVTWGWKDSMLDRRQWYYGKLLRGKATIVSLATIPCFYALSDRVGDLDDYLLAYDEGRLTWEEKSIADALLNHGPLHTIELRRRSFLSSESAKSRFERALTALQRGLWILPVGIARAGGWRYAFVYELFDRWFPQVVMQARPIKRREAFRQLTCAYLDSVGAAKPESIARVFQREKKEVKRALLDLEEVDLARATTDDLWVTRSLI